MRGGGRKGGEGMREGGEGFIIHPTASAVSNCLPVFVLLTGSLEPTFHLTR